MYWIFRKTASYFFLINAHEGTYSKSAAYIQHLVHRYYCHVFYLRFGALLT